MESSGLSASSKGSKTTTLEETSNTGTDEGSSEVESTSDKSRLNKEFEDHEYVAKGGFGSVYKAKHRIDDRVYAIKEIRLNSRSQQQTRDLVTTEVKLLSSLQTHDNVVRYYGSWIEECDDRALKSDSSGSLLDLPSPTRSQLSDKIGIQATDSFSSNEMNNDDRATSSSSSGGIVFKKSDDYDDQSSSAALREYMYIQMDFCENGTLRKSINTGLYNNIEQIWQLFREIVNGLVHIHNQGVIHRDLSPLNIFLDSNYHARIGDFGLSKKLSCESTHSNSKVSPDLEGNAYISPEAKSGNYTKKMDMYSLGIILFEMCNPPLLTKSERAHILDNLRKKEIIFPSSFKKHKETEIIVRLLTHDPEKRPCSKKMLKELEESDSDWWQKFLEMAISDRDSKEYKQMMNALLSQTENNDLAYDADLLVFSPETTMALTFVEKTLSDIFQRHGAVQIKPPLFMPTTDVNKKSVRLLDHTGLVSVPYDMHTPFARFVARNDISLLKRFCITHVYKERQEMGLHPKEDLRCTFDIVTPNAEKLVTKTEDIHKIKVPDAEVIYTVVEVINQFWQLRGRYHFVRLNHICLVKAVMIHCGIEEGKHPEVFKILAQFTWHEKEAMKAELCSQCSLSAECVTSFFDLMNTSAGEDKLSDEFMGLWKTITDATARSYLEQGHREIKAILANLKTMGNQLPVTVSFGMMFNMHNSSGIMFRVMTKDENTSYKAKYRILAVGCRYDSLIGVFNSPLQLQSVMKKSAVGVSIFVEKIVRFITKRKEFQPSRCDVYVCGSYMQNELVSQLWSLGLRADINYNVKQDMEQIQPYCRQENIAHIAFIESKSNARVLSLENDEWVEQWLDIAEVATYLSKKTSTEGASLNVEFVMKDSSMDGTDEQRSRICAKTLPMLERLCGKNGNMKNKIKVLAIDVDMSVIKTIASCLELGDTEESYNISVHAITSKHKDLKDYLVRLLHFIRCLKFKFGETPSLQMPFEKVMIPRQDHPDINWIGLLIGTRTNTLQDLKKKTGASVIIRGRGTRRRHTSGGTEEPLHAYIEACNTHNVKLAAAKVKEIIELISRHHDSSEDDLHQKVCHLLDSMPDGLPDRVDMFILFSIADESYRIVG